MPCVQVPGWPEPQVPRFVSGDPASLGVWPNLATDELLEELEMEEHCRGHSPLLPTLSPRVSRSFHQQAAGTTKSGRVFATALAQPRLRGDGEMSS